MSGPVFLSYAHEDSAAAQGMAVALRAFGIEVWLDQSELRGGEAWDASIRQQIRSCALFLAVIDETPESKAAVPESFLRVQWIRLPGGVPSTQFVDQVKRLLDPARSAGRAPAQDGLPERARPPSARFPRRVAIGCCALVLTAPH